MAQSSLSQIINDRRIPRLDNVEAIARALGTTVAYLIGETANPAPHLDAGQPAPETLAWSEQLRALTPEQRAVVVSVIEAILRLATGATPPSGSPAAKRAPSTDAQ